ncbi:MAG: hypothetical protein OXF49_00175 [Candidatus Saccharibacteria bacterium]|nr:hypothetical protein [Candidatus Saccharibacteria bacterium]
MSAFNDLKYYQQTKRDFITGLAIYGFRLLRYDFKHPEVQRMLKAYVEYANRQFSKQEINSIHDAWRRADFFISSTGWILTALMWVGIVALIGGFWHDNWLMFWLIAGISLPAWIMLSVMGTILVRRFEMLLAQLFAKLENETDSKVYFKFYNQLDELNQLNR